MNASIPRTALDQTLTCSSSYGEVDNEIETLAGMLLPDGDSGRGKLARSRATSFISEGTCGVMILISQVAIDGQIRGERVEQMTRAMVFCVMVMRYESMEISNLRRGWI